LTRINGTTILAIATACLYSSSTANVNAYLGVLELNRNMLDRDFHQVLYHGMILNLPLMYLVPLYLLSAILLYSFIKATTIKFLQTSTENKRIYIKITRKLKNITSYVYPYPYRGPYMTTFMRDFALVCLILLPYIFPLIEYEKDGAKAGHSVLLALEEENFQEIIVSIGNEEHRLAHLYCGSRNCAGYDIENKLIRYFPQKGHAYVIDLTKKF